MDVVYIDKCRYDIQEEELPVWYIGIPRTISSTNTEVCLV
jgi:hypothetical protein